MASIVPRGSRIADQAQIGVVLLHRLVDAVRMLIFESHVGLGIVAEKLLQITVHVVQSDRIDRHHPHPAGNFFVQRAHLVFQRVVALHQLATAFVVGFALGREHEGSFRAIDRASRPAAARVG